MSEKITATFLREVDRDYGTARLYELSEAINARHSTIEKTRYALVVSLVSTKGPETYIFPADETGQSTSIIELRGSFRRDLDCEAAIRSVGWEVAA